MSAGTPGAHPLAIVSLSSSLLAYASSFVGSPALIWPALGAAAIAVLSGHSARRAIRRAPARRGGRAFATAGLVSGYAYLALGAGLLMSMRSVAAA